MLHMLAWIGGHIYYKAIETALIVLQNWETESEKEVEKINWEETLHEMELCS